MKKPDKWGRVPPGYPTRNDIELSAALLCRCTTTATKRRAAKASASSKVFTRHETRDTAFSS